MMEYFNEELIDRTRRFYFSLLQMVIENLKLLD